MFFAACKEEPQYDTLYPKAYFPAYPGSYWVYSNGVTKVTDAYYRLHTINTQDVYVPIYDGKVVIGYTVDDKQIINFDDASWKVDEFQDNNIYRKIVNLDTSLDIIQYPYHDSIHCDTIFEQYDSIPVDTIFSLVEVSDCNGSEYCDTVFVNCDTAGCDTLFYTLLEQIVYYDTLIVDTIISNCDSISHYDSVIVVREFTNSLDELNCWFTQEYYAKNVGLVKKEVSSCSDSTATITEFELVKYFINK